MADFFTASSTDTSDRHTPVADQRIERMGYFASIGDSKAQPCFADHSVGSEAPLASPAESPFYHDTSLDLHSEAEFDI